MLEKDLRELINARTELANLDYKAGFPWKPENRDKKYELIKDIMAMANTKDGGRIIFGVNDDSFEFIGVSEDVFTSIDPTDVMQTVHQYGDPKVTCEISKIELEGKKVVVFDIREFSDAPIICIDSIKSADQTKFILRKGAIYIRTAAATTEEIPSAQEMRELLGRAILKKGDELLGSIERLITGKPVRPTDDSANQYKIEIEQVDIFLKESLGKGFLQIGRWELIAYPTYYNGARIKELPAIKKLIQDCAVTLRGWDFPHTDRKNASIFNHGYQSFNVWDR